MRSTLTLRRRVARTAQLRLTSRPATGCRTPRVSTRSLNWRAPHERLSDSKDGPRIVSEIPRCYLGNPTSDAKSAPPAEGLHIEERCADLWSFLQVGPAMMAGGFFAATSQVL